MEQNNFFDWGNYWVNGMDIPTWNFTVIFDDGSKFTTMGDFFGFPPEWEDMNKAIKKLTGFEGF